MRDGTVTALEDVPVMDCLLLWMNVNIAPLGFFPLCTRTGRDLPGLGSFSRPWAIIKR